MKLGIRFIFIVLALMLSGVILSALLISTLQVLDLEQIFLLKLGQLISAVCIFLLPPIFATKFFFGNIQAFLDIKKVDFRKLILSAIFIIIAIPAIDMFSKINQNLHFPEFLSGIERWAREQESIMTETTKLLLSGNSFGDLFLNIIVIAAVAAISEEVLFRGFIQNILRRKINAHIAIWITAIVFSAIHLQPLGFIPRMLLGAGLGYLAYYSGSIIPSIIAHFTNNAIAVLLYFYFQTEEYNIFEGNKIYIAGIVSLLLAISTLLYFKKNK